MAGDASFEGEELLQNPRSGLCQSSSGGCLRYPLVEEIKKPIYWLLTAIETRTEHRICTDKMLARITKIR
mgnify:FL=1